MDSLLRSKLEALIERWNSEQYPTSEAGAAATAVVRGSIAELRAILAEPEPSPWQPIETIPKEPEGAWGDGPRVLLRRGSRFCGEGYWSHVRKAYYSDSECWIHSEFAPTHWAPMSLLQLPEPPK